MENADKMLFRCSGLGHIMTDPKGKTPKEKYDEAKQALTKYKNDYELTKNKDTKTAKNKLALIQKTNNLILELENSKGDVQLSDTCINHLLELYANLKHKRREEIKSKFLRKGNEREQAAITLVSLLTYIPFKKNTERLQNEFISGELDIFVGDEILKAKETLDTKVSWSYLTWIKTHVEDIKKGYYWQGQGYMSLTGAKKHTICYCLMNGTLQAINDEIRKLSWEHGILDASLESNVDFKEKCKQIERNHIFDIDGFMKENEGYQPFNEVIEFKHKDGVVYTWEYDIPKEERLYRISFDRCDEDIDRMEARIIDCRKWMNKNLFTNLKKHIHVS